MSLRFAIAALFFIPIVPAAIGQPHEVTFERQVTGEGIEIGIWSPASGTPVHPHALLPLQRRTGQFRGRRWNPDTL